MKLKTKNSAKKPVNINKNNSPKKQSKGVAAKKEKSKEVVKPTVLKKEAEKATHVEALPSPHKLLQQELWKKAIENVSKMSNLSDEESSVVKLLADYKKKASIPQKCIKLKNFITKGFSKFKDTNDEVLQGIYEKLLSEFKAIGGKSENDENKKLESKPKSKKEASDDEEMVVNDEGDDEDGNDDDNEDDDDNIDDETESIEVGNSEDDEESEEEKPKAKVKPNNKNGKNGSKFKGGKVQKNKKFNKKK